MLHVCVLRIMLSVRHNMLRKYMQNTTLADTLLCVCACHYKEKREGCGDAGGGGEKVKLMREDYV